MPSIGEAMTVFCRLTSAWVSEARACASWACALRTCAFAVRSATSAASRSVVGISCFSASCVCSRRLGLRVAQRHLRPLEVRLRAGQIRARRIDLRLEQRRIEPGEHLSLADDRVEVGVRATGWFRTPGCPPEPSSPPRACLSRRSALTIGPRVTDAGDDRRRRLAAPRVERADGQARHRKNPDDDSDSMPHVVSSRELCRDPWSGIGVRDAVGLGLETGISHEDLRIPDPRSRHQRTVHRHKTVFR